MAQYERFCLFFGAVAAVLFLANTTILGMLLPGYDPVVQTISEIGERGSPFEFAFGVGPSVVAACLVLFALGVARFSRRTGRSILPALLLGGCGLALIGTAIFESPHPLHNLFGISTMLGFVAPLVLAASWPARLDLRLVRQGSIWVGGLLAVGMALNLSPLFIDYQPSDFIRANYGAVQRLVLIPFYLWCGFLAVGLLAAKPAASPRA